MEAVLLAVFVEVGGSPRHSQPARIRLRLPATYSVLLMNPMRALRMCQRCVEKDTAMAGRKRNKRRAHRAQRGATTRSKTRPSPAAAPSAARPGAEQEASPARVRSRDGAKEIRQPPARTSLPVMSGVARLGPLATALLPARVFFAMGRPVPGLVCCILQASLLGWLPAALWAFRAERRVTLKHRGLAARLRPL